MVSLTMQVEDAQNAIRHYEEMIEVPKWLQKCFQDTEQEMTFQFKTFTIDCLFSVKRVYGKEKKIINGKEKGYFYVLERCLVTPKAGLSAEEVRYVRAALEL